MLKEYKHLPRKMSILCCTNMTDLVSQVKQNQNAEAELDVDVNELSTKTKQNTDYLTLEGQEFTAKVVYIYDGDTVHVVFKAFGEYYRWNSRIMGVDTPESVSYTHLRAHET